MKSLTPSLSHPPVPMDETLPQSAQAPWQTLYLLPEDIATDTAFELPGRGKKAPDPAKEKRLISSLADSIEKNGQLDPGIVVLDPRSDADDPTYVIYAGHRRRLALLELNKRRNGSGQIPMTVRLDPSPMDDIKRKLLASNIQREGLSPIALGEACLQVRKENGWEDKKHTQKVADYLNVDQATVTTHEKLVGQLSTKPKLRAKVEAGVLSAESAMGLAEVDEDVATRIIDTAAEKQAAKRKAEGKAPQKRVESPELKAATRQVRDSIKSDKAKAVATGDKKAAAKLSQVETQLEKVKTKRTLKDVVELLGEIDSPVYGGESSPARAWARYVRDKWVPGDGTNKTVHAKLAEILTAAAVKVSAEDRAKEKAAASVESKAGAKGGKK